MLMYYYIDKEGNQKGPVSAGSLKANGVTDNTLVWKAGMEQWTQAKDVPELRSFFHLPQTPPPPPVPPTPPFTQGYSKSADSNASYDKAAQAQAQTASPAEMPKPDNYLVWSILCTICCCTPLGIYCIICSSQVDSLYKAGDYEKAAKKANETKTCCIVAAVAGAIGSILYGICYALSMC